MMRKTAYKIFYRGIVVTGLLLLASQGHADTQIIIDKPGGTAYAPPTATTDMLALQQRFEDLQSPDAKRASDAIKALMRDGRPEIIPALIAGLREGAAPRAEYLGALAQLTGQDPTKAPDTWYEWAAWAQKQPSWPVNPALDAVLAARAGRVDAGYRDLLPPATTLSVPTHELVFDGSFLDQAGVIEHPVMAHASRAQQINGSDVVVALPARNGDKARAWPLKLLAGETVINDVWAGLPITITYSPLCGTVLVLDRQNLPKNRNASTTLLRPTGLLHRGRPMLYNRETQGLWNGCTGHSLTQTPAQPTLSLLPATTTSWTKWAHAHPDSLVMIDDRPAARAEAMLVRLEGYGTTRKPLWPVAMYDTQYEPKEKAIAVANPDGHLIGVELLSNLANRPMMNADFGAQRVLFVAENTRMPSLMAFRTAADLFFAATAHPGRIQDQQGGLWTISEEGLIGPTGQVLARLPVYSGYWFVFQDLLPEITRIPPRLGVAKAPVKTPDPAPAPASKPLDLTIYAPPKDNSGIWRTTHDPVPFGKLRFPPPPRPQRPVFMSMADEAGLERMPGPLTNIERLRLARQPSIIPPRAPEDRIVHPNDKPKRPDISGTGH